MSPEGSGAAAVAVPAPRAEMKSLGLVSTGHVFSHFYMFALPPLFPLLKAEIGVNYAELGVLLAVYATTTGVFQVPAGVIVDRFGGRSVFLAGLALNAAAVALFGLVTDYWMMVALMALAGLGNSVFHPADYAILSARIGNARIGRAFSVHQFAGYLGWMLAPPAMLALSSAMGWRGAVIAVGALGLVFAAAAAPDRDALGGRVVRDAAREAKRGAMWTLLRSRPVIMFFLLFFLLSASASAVQTFSVVASMTFHGLSLEAANFDLTGYFVAGGLGVIAGGFIIDRIKRPDLMTAIAYIVAAAFVFPLGFHGLAPWAITALLAVHALFLSSVNAARDVMVRNIAPPGTIGTVFGVISSGFSLGFMVGPPFFGWVLDIGEPRYVYWLSAVILLIAILTVFGARSPGQGARS